MIQRDINWAFWRTFLAAMETGSLSGAAKRLLLTQPTVGRHIDDLERAIDGTLFLRSQSGLTPTALAHALLPHANAMAAAAHTLTRSASGGADALEGTLRISASEIVAAEVLPGSLTRFRQTYPRSTFEMVLSNSQLDLLRRDADIAVRMIRPKQKTLLTKKIGVVAIGLYAHKDYIGLNGMPLALSDLARHQLIGIDRATDRLAGVKIGGEDIATLDFSFRCDSDIGQLAALRAGLGIGVCQNHLARKEPNLVPVLPDQVTFDLEMWLAMHKNLKSDPLAGRVFDHLAQDLPLIINGLV